MFEQAWKEDINEFKKPIETVENTVKKSGYLTLEITNTKITGKFYQITGNKMINEYNGKTYDYTPDTEDAVMTRELLDTWTINLSDRA